MVTETLPTLDARASSLLHLGPGAAREDTALESLSRTLHAQAARVAALGRLAESIDVASRGGARELLQLAASAAQTRGAYVRTGQTNGTLVPLSQHKGPRVGSPLTLEEFEECETALRGNLTKNEVVLRNLLARGALPDVRLLSRVCDALRTFRSAQSVLRWVLPAYGILAQQELVRQCNPNGGLVDAMRLLALARWWPKESVSTAELALQSPREELRWAALAFAEHLPEERWAETALECEASEANLLLTLPLGWDGSEEHTSMPALRALRLLRTDEALERLIERTRAGGLLYDQETSHTLAFCLRESRHPRAAQTILSLLESTLRGLTRKTAPHGTNVYTAVQLALSLGIPSRIACSDTVHTLYEREQNPATRTALALALHGMGDPRGTQLLRGETFTNPPESSELLSLITGGLDLFWHRVALLFDEEHVRSNEGIEQLRGLLRRLREFASKHFSRPIATTVALRALAVPELYREVKFLCPALLANASASQRYEALHTYFPGGKTEDHQRAVGVLRWVSGWEPYELDPRWVTHAQATLMREKSTRSERGAAVLLLAKLGNDEAGAALIAEVREDLERRERSAPLHDALLWVRDEPTNNALRLLLSEQKPKSWEALYAERLLARMKEPRTTPAGTESWQLL